MSKERLEEFKKFIDYLYDSLDMEDHQRFDDTVRSLVRDRWFDWVYRYAKKQAEHVQELEEENFQLKDDVNRMENEYLHGAKTENKRYREAIENIQDIQQWHRKEPDYEVLNIVNKALEGEE